MHLSGRPFFLSSRLAYRDADGWWTMPSSSFVPNTGPKVGPILLQLPARLIADCERLRKFIQLLKPGRRYAFEFRHPSWFERPVLKLLIDYDIALCFSDHRDAPTPWEVTASFVYVRGHGPGGFYKGQYSERTLRTWAQSFVNWRRRSRDVYVYFDNDQKAAAPADAKRLAKMIRDENTRRRSP